MVKKCAKCLEVKSVGSFSLRPTGKPTSYCKNCVLVYSRAHYKRNKHIHNPRRHVRNKRHRKEMRKFIVELKCGRPCGDCKQKFPHYVMDFHHRDRATKKFGISCGTSQTKEVILAEVSKCDLLCSNCHREREFGNWAKG